MTSSAVTPEPPAPKPSPPSPLPDPAPPVPRPDPFPGPTPEPPSPGPDRPTPGPDPDLPPQLSGQPAVCVFSPAPLLTITIEIAVDGREELHLHPGGQGFWVARLASLLGAQPVLCAPFGGETGTVLHHLVEEAEIRVRPIPMPAPNGSYVHDRRDGERVAVWESELDVLGRHELDELYTATLAEGLAAGVCVLAGSQQQEIIAPDTYRRLASDLRSNGVRVVADLSGSPLQSALAGGIDLLKISHEELVEDGLARDESVEAIRDGIDLLQDAGARDVVVSRASDGTIARVGGRLLEVRAPAMEVLDARGAGDSMTAALAVALALGLETEASLKLAAAAGALNVTRHGLGSGRYDAIAQLAENVVVTQVDG